MDDLIIDDKKYVSSKQAAKITGYAKDYVGQLCREGRVQARLVGRSWYVLESSIQDHRFGKQVEEEKPTHDNDALVAQISLPTWEAPRYEPIESEPLPTIRPREEVEVETTEVVPSTEQIQAAWESIYTAPDAAEVQEEVIITELPPVAEQPKEQSALEAPAAMSMDIPLQRHADLAITKKAKRSNRILYIKLVSAMLVLAGLASAAIAAVNSGYFDDYVISANRVPFITGLSVYEK